MENEIKVRIFENCHLESRDMTIFSECSFESLAKTSSQVTIRFDLLTPYLIEATFLSWEALIKGCPCFHVMRLVYRANHCIMTLLSFGGYRTIVFRFSFF